MSLLLTSASPLKLPDKRLCEHGRHRFPEFPPSFKRPKADAIRQFPKHCGGFSGRTKGDNEGFISGQSSKPASVAGEVVGDGSEPLRTLTPVNLTSESATPGNVDFVQQEIMLKRRQGVVVIRQFPPNCGVSNHAFLSRHGVMPDEKSVIEQNPPKKMEKICEKSVRDENISGIGQKNDGNVSDGRIVEHQDKCVYVINGENCELVRRKTSKCTGEPEKDEENVNLVSSSFHSNSKCQNISKEDANSGHESHKGEFVDVGKSGSELIPEDNESSVTEENSTMGDQYRPAVIDNNELVNFPKAEEISDLRVLTYEECLAVDHCNKVREALKLFDELYGELVQKRKENPKAQPKTLCQLPVEAARILKKQQKWVDRESEFGHVPGVKIGDTFRFRAELAVVGLHHQYIGGIHYVRIGKEEYATSIVDSGRYENETRSSDILIYLGQGGNPKVADRKPADQKLEGPNRALMNSMAQRWPVRVIRGRETAKASNRAVPEYKRSRQYVYDGLYTVMKCTQERDQHGKLVYKFELHRIPGQPKLIHVPGLKPKESTTRRDNCVVSDVSQGKEKLPIHAVNAINNEKPPPFTYMEKMIYPDWYRPPLPSGCNCVNGCSDSDLLCSCAAKNGGEIPFNDKHAIIRAKPIVHECGPSCKCPPSCKNRVSQRGPKYSLEVFRTESRGWGVRSRHFISSGSFICEYIGELLNDKEAERRINHDEYLFDIGNHLEESQSKYQKNVNDEGLAIIEGHKTQPNCLEASEGEGFAIDAEKLGNVGRFINHSCSPNLFAQNVFYDHDDYRVPHIMLFAAKSIRPLTELTYDYNYKMDRVCDSNGNIKKKECYCGSRECTGRMY